MALTSSIRGFKERLTETGEKLKDWYGQKKNRVLLRTRVSRDRILSKLGLGPSILSEFPNNPLEIDREEYIKKPELEIEDIEERSKVPEFPSNPLEVDWKEYIEKPELKIEDIEERFKVEKFVEGLTIPQIIKMRKNMVERLESQAYSGNRFKYNAHSELAMKRLMNLRGRDFEVTEREPQEKSSELEAKLVGESPNEEDLLAYGIHPSGCYDFISEDAS